MLPFLTILSYLAWVVSVVGIMMVACLLLTSLYAITACDMVEENDENNDDQQLEVQIFFTILSRSLASYANVGEVNADKFCKFDDVIYDSIQYMVISVLLIVIGQVNFFGIMTDNFRVAINQSRDLIKDSTSRSPHVDNPA